MKHNFKKKVTWFRSKLKLNRQKIRIGLIVLVLILLILNIVLANNNLQTKTVILGLKLNNQPLTFLTRPEIEQVVKKELIKQQKNSLRFSYQDQILEIKGIEIGVNIDPIASTNILLKEGRSGSFVQDITTQTQALLGLKQQKLNGDISQVLLTIKILELQNQVNKEATPIKPNFTADLNQTIPAQDGVKIDTNKLTILIADNVFNPPQTPIPLPVIKTFTSHGEEELTAIRKQALTLVNQPLSISSGELVFTLTTTDLKGLLTVIERPDPGNPKRLALSLRLDDVKLNQKLGEFAAKVENISHAEFDDHDARVAVYSQFFSGQRKLVQIPTGNRLDSKLLGITNSPKVVYLTFDDGPNSIYHPLILDILKAYNIKATFFLVGQNSQRDLEIAKRTMAEGHVIGNHTLTHAFLPRLKSGSILNELKATEDILTPLKSGSVLFRPPFGGINLNVKKHAEALGLKLTLWDLDPRDWSEPPPEVLVSRVVSHTRPGTNILLHSNHLVTVKALPKIIEALKNQGYSFEVLN